MAAQRAEERRRIEEEEKMMKWGKEEEIRKEEQLRNRPLAMYSAFHLVGHYINVNKL